ncbi:hypothetical protein B1H58_02480 [Pantoea alhagi]|uniref:Uncharacterized protein n=1 Tax=Pantoea alhagi TaxID=1891675 RepID=A0A1W6B1L4_9GAMM|nr:hypothetical protein B1H58_02480 [Pantoea alhagi]
MLKIFYKVASINSDACKSCMDLHANNTCEKHEPGQSRRGLSLYMHLHEKRYIKRAGVAGIALRAEHVLEVNTFKRE